MCKCMRCHHELIISGNAMLSDLELADSQEDDAIITYMSCPFCGTQYEITDTPESERQKYPYWNKKLIDINNKNKS